MKTDIKGYSTCPIGQEKYEFFCLYTKEFVQYDYRHTNGNLFSCVARTLNKARQRRDNWLNDQK